MNNTWISCSKTISLNNYRASQHFAQRAEARHLSEDQVQFALLFGTRMYCGGACAYIVRRQDIPVGTDAKLVRRYHGMVVITTLDSFKLVTTYQDPHAYTQMKKKFRH